MPERVLRPSRIKQILWVAVCCGMAALELAAPAPRDWSRWVNAGFWSAVAFILATQLVPGAAYLRLDAAGFEVRFFFRTYGLRAEALVRLLNEYKALAVA